MQTLIDTSKQPIDSCTCTSACTYIWTIHWFDSWAVNTLLKARVTSLVRHHPNVVPSLTLPLHVTNSTITTQVIGDLMLLFQSSYSSEIPTSWSNIEHVPTHRLPYVHLISSTLSTRSKDTLIGNIELQYRNWSYATFLVPWRPYALSPSLLKVNLSITADITPVVLITCYLTSFPCSLFQLHLKGPFTTAGMRPLCALAPHIAQNPIMARCLCLVTSSTVLLITQLYFCVSYSSFVNLLRKSRQYIQRSTGMQLRLQHGGAIQKRCAIEKGP